MNIVVAMAGLGSRFQEQGHLYPKPLIRTGNTTMIQNVYYSLEWPDADWHFVVKMQHLRDHPFMKSLLESMGSITAIEETTRGAAETLQKCNEVMTSSKPFISVNCDQVFEWDTTSLQKKITNNPETSYIAIYNHTDTERHSFAHTDGDTDKVHLCTEKTTAGLPTNNATTGFYHFHNGEIFNNSVNTLLSKPPEYGEYYVAAVYNELITEGHDVRVDRVHANTFWPVGVQHDWQHYTHRHYRK
jgi:NDP-sugar pyrophosphorylase family protein